MIVAVPDTATLLRSGGNPADSFASVSFIETKDPTLMEVGIGYSIDVPKYREYLAKHAID
jgi:hypothetical protein